MAETDDDDWQLWWDARQLALESDLGKSDLVVGHALIPLYLGAEAGGAADLMYFRNHLSGVVAVTADLIGFDEQLPNTQDAYELMICHRQDDDIGFDLIAGLANYTVDAILQPGETMGITSAVPNGSTIAALLFFDYARFEVRRRACGLLLCIGITSDELKHCRAGNRAVVEARLEKSREVYPFTDWHRWSVFS